MDRIFIKDNRFVRYRKPLWMKRIGEQGDLQYSVHPWIPCKANMVRVKCNKHKFGGDISQSSVTDTYIGLGVALGEGTGKIKGFRLKDAIMYSYLRDIRFVTLTSLLIGISMWWVDVPTALFNIPEALRSPDLALIVRSVKDVYVNNICSEHAVPSPCDCGERLNKTVMDLIKPEKSFDPLQIDKKRAVAFYVASVIIVLALSESVCISGVMVS